MIDFRERLKSHPAYSSMKQLEATIGKIRKERSFSDKEQRHAFARLILASRHICNCLSERRSAYVTPTALNSIHRALMPLVSGLESWVNGNNWDAIANHTDAVLDQFKRLPIPIGVEESAADVSKMLEEQTSRIIAELSEKQQDELKKLNTAKESLEGKLKKFSGELKTLKEETEGQKQVISEQLTNQTTQFTAAELKRNEDFQHVEGTRKSYFEKTLKDAHTDLKKLKDEQVEALKGLEEKHGKAFEDLISQHLSISKETIQSLESYSEEAKKIVGLIGNTGMSGHYQKVADHEKTAANFFRRLAIGFFIVMVGSVGFIVWEYQDQGFDWQAAMFRLAITGVLAIPATYCARESTRHRMMEHRMRRLELELASINPYLATLDEDKSQAVIEKLASQYFGDRTRGDDKTADDLKDISLRGDQILKIMEDFAKILKK